MLGRHKKKLFALAVFAAASLYLFWPGVSPNLSKPPALYLTTSDSFGIDTGGGNVVGIEPYMEPLDYATAERFKAKLDGYLKAAKSKGWIRENTVVLLPEHIGTWLMARNQKSRVYNADNTSAALLPLATHNIISMAKNLLIFDEEDSLSAAVIRVRTETTAKALLEIFGSLARTYQITIVAGSAALMTPGVYVESLSYGHGPIFNAGFVFGPDGKPQIDAIRKVHPIPSESGFTTASKAAFLPVFDAGVKPFGVLICADSWFDEPASYLGSEGAQVILVPSFLTGTDWNAPWQGYLNDVPTVEDWKQDVGKITEGDAWIKYALPAKARANNIQWGMNVFLKGNLWGMKGSGRALILENGTLHIGKGGDDGAALYNLWLN